MALTELLDPDLLTMVTGLHLYDSGALPWEKESSKLDLVAVQGHAVDVSAHTSALSQGPYARSRWCMVMR